MANKSPISDTQLRELAARNIARFDEFHDEGDDVKVVCPVSGGDHLSICRTNNRINDFGGHDAKEWSRALLRIGVLPTFYSTEYEYRREDGKVQYVHVKRRDLTNPNNTGIGENQPKVTTDYMYGIHYSSSGVPVRKYKKGALEGLPKVLYDLPLLKQSTSIWICAGEKDAEIARYLLGHNATTRPNGEAHWDDRYYEQLAHATHVTIVIDIDDDDAGYRGGWTVYSRLKQHFPEMKIRIRRPADGLKDLFDHVHYGHSEDELVKVPPAELQRRGKPKPKERSTETVAQSNEFEYTQSEYADRFVAKYGDRFRYISSEDCWLYYSDGRWREDQYDAAFHFAESVCRDILRETPRYIDSTKSDNGKRPNPAYQLAKERCGSGNIASVCRISRTRRPVVTVRRKLDTDPYLVNFPNGTLDIRTGELRDHDPGDMITKMCTYEYDATATGPEFDAYFANVQPDPHWREQIIRTLGYSICGRYGEYIFVHTGSGGNGKSTLLKLAAKVFGDYAITASWKVLSGRSESEHETLMAALEHHRLAIVQMGGHSLSSEQLRTLVAEPDFTARKMREDERVIEATHTFHVAQNDAPPLKSLDASTRRRIIVVNWGVTIDDPDETLRERIAENEGSYVVTLLVNAFRRFKANDIDRAHTKEYFEKNRVFRYVSERLEEGDDSEFISAAELHNDYQKWCSEHNETPENETRFGTTLTQLGYARGHGTVEGRTQRVRYGVRYRTT